MVSFPRYGQVGYETLYQVNGGRLAEDYNQAYPTPFKIQYAGLYLKMAKSTTYDPTAMPTYLVAIPCNVAGELPEGWAWKTTARTDQLPGAPVTFLPETPSPNTPANSQGDFVTIAVCPIKEGEKIGVPVKANQDIAVGDEIAVAVGGFAKKAVSGDWVIGRAESNATTDASADGQMFVAVKHIIAYKKA